MNLVGACLRQCGQLPCDTCEYKTVKLKKINAKQKIIRSTNKYKEKKRKTIMKQRACLIGQVSYYKVIVLLLNCKIWS